MKDKTTRWTASTFSKSDLNKLYAVRLLAATIEVMMPIKEIIPHPQEDFQVMFTQFLLCGLSLPVYEFLRGLLFVYDVQLHQLTSNSILYIACFVTLCECFLGIDPHWGLWRRIFYIQRNVSRPAVHDVGGTIISMKGQTGYFDLRMKDFVQDWQNKWFYVNDEPINGRNTYLIISMMPLK
jgi:hypothetical protein